MALARHGHATRGPSLAQAAIALFARFLPAAKKVTRTWCRCSTSATSGATAMWPVSKVR